MEDMTSVLEAAPVDYMSIIKTELMASFMAEVMAPMDLCISSGIDYSYRKS